MNIYILDRDPAMAARYHADRHLPTAIQNICALLFAAHVMCDGNQRAQINVGALNFMRLPQASDINHRCALWVRASSQNYRWAAKLFGQLCLEYTLRTSKVHPQEQFVDLLQRWPQLIPVGELTPFQQCMPEEYRRYDGDAVGAYRDYMCSSVKRGTMQWAAPAAVPHWYSRVLRSGAAQALRQEAS